MPDGAQGRYQYDPQGRRVERSTTTLLGDSTIHYVFDGLQILFTLNSANNAVAVFTNGPNVDEPLIMRNGGQDYFFHQDALNSVVALTDISATIVEAAQYEAYGLAVIKNYQGQIQEGSSVGNPYLFAGREFDAERQQYFNRNRQTYDPNIGRFNQEDPIGFDSGVTNLYAYASNTPANFNDPLGLFGPFGPPEEPPRRSAGSPVIVPPVNPAKAQACYAILMKDAVYDVLSHGLQLKFGHKLPVELHAFCDIGLSAWATYNGIKAVKEYYKCLDEAAHPYISYPGPPPEFKPQFPNLSSQ